MSGDTTAVREPTALGVGEAYRLVVLYAPGEGAGRSIALDGDAITLGRGDDADISLQDSACSRHHAKLSYANAGWTLSDLKARNGTWLNGARIDEAPLKSGAVMRVGDTILLFEALASRDLSLLLESRDSASCLRGEGAATRRVAARLRALAKSSDPTLILGESGSGKERAAEELHRLSERKGAFVPVNCAAIPAQLAESEFFGHAAGAFTGATGARDGLFAQADGGTLFLDEVGELPIELQPKLLRALATGEIRRVSDSKVRRVDVRLVAATHVDLEAAVEANAFRPDLYSRLSAEPVRMPSLRERPVDIVQLTTEIETLDWSKLDGDVAEALLTYPWPYNVRELLQAARTVQRGLAAGETGLALLPDRIRDAYDARRGGSSEQAARRIELPLALRVARDRAPNEEELRTLLQHFDANVARVADYFGKDRRQVYRWMDRYQIALEDLRDEG
ncbi:MAG: sigma 54-interacting transcriptional regulator [Myxococcota bacterium]